MGSRQGLAGMRSMSYQCTLAAESVRPKSPGGLALAGALLLAIALAGCGQGRGSLAPRPTPAATGSPAPPAAVSPSAVASTYASASAVPPGKAALQLATPEAAATLSIKPPFPSGPAPTGALVA